MKNPILAAKINKAQPLASLESIWAIEETRLGSLLLSMDAETVEVEMAAGRFGVDAILEVIRGVAIIDIRGVINKRWSYPGWAINVFDIQDAIARAVEDRSITAILLRVDSPGGSVDGLAEAGDAIFEARQSKNVIAQITGMGASAAYYLASQANAIYAQRMDLIGSIGVRMLIYDWSRLFANAGVRAIPIDTGKYKSAGAMGTELTTVQQDYLQRLVDDFFADFLDVVARGRGLSVEKIRQSADGRVFSAPAAVERGLIDGVRTFESTLAELFGEQSEQVGRAIAATEDRKGDTDMSQTSDVVSSAGASQATPVPATIADLKREIPDSDASFREQCIEAGCTLAQAKDRWMDTLRAHNATLSKESEALRRATAEAVGTQTVGTQAGDVQSTVDGTDAIAEFEAAFNARLARGMDRYRAMRETVVEDKQRHAAYVDAYNALNSSSRRKVGKVGY